MSWPRPTRATHERFCRTEGWTEVRNARGKTGHHVTFELALPDGRVLRTRVSHPVDATDYGPEIWRHILRDQLEVSDAEFWACVQHRTKPRRGPERVVTAAAIPVDVAWQLVHKVGLAPDEVARLTRDEAIARLQEHWRGSP